VFSPLAAPRVFSPLGTAEENNTLPSDLANLELWLRADDITGADGDAVSAWVSREGSSYSFAATLTTRPLLRLGANGINSKPTVLFDGVNDALVLSSSIFNTSAGTIFAVIRFTSTLATGAQSIIGSGDEASATRLVAAISMLASATPTMRIFQRNNDVATTATGNTSMIAAIPYRQMFRSSGTSYTLKVNNTVQTLTGTNNGDWFADTANRDNTVIGANKVSSVVNFFKGDIAEIIVYGRELSDIETSKIENYLSDRYGAF